jgi:hypothetical protein
MADDAKKTILSRRARFVAAAVAGLGVSACGKSTVPPDAGETPVASESASPAPCLTVFPEPPPPPIDGGNPVPCLTIARPPPEEKCNPPYTVEADGKKKYKVECLK